MLTEVTVFERETNENKLGKTWASWGARMKVNKFFKKKVNAKKTGALRKGLSKSCLPYDYTRGAAQVQQNPTDGRNDAVVSQDTAFPAMCASNAHMARNATIMCIFLTSRHLH